MCPVAATLPSAQWSLLARLITRWLYLLLTVLQLSFVYAAPNWTGNSLIITLAKDMNSMRHCFHLPLCCFTLCCSMPLYVTQAMQHFMPWYRLHLAACLHMFWLNPDLCLAVACHPPRDGYNETSSVPGSKHFHSLSSVSTIRSRADAVCKS